MLAKKANMNYGRIALDRGLDATQNRDRLIHWNICDTIEKAQVGITYI